MNALGSMNRRGLQWLAKRLALPMAFGVLLGPTLLSAATFTPADSAAFTTALNTCSLGDTIILQANATYSGSFTLPNKTTGTGYVTIQSSAVASLPSAGTRISTANAANMPKVRSSGANNPAILTATSAHHYKLIGLEIIGPTTGDLHTLVSLGTSGTAQDTDAEAPYEISIQRCIIRANSASQGLTRGVALNSKSTEILDSRIEGCKALGADSQAICGWNGAGPFTITNNYLEGAGENVMFGGADPSIPNLVPSNITIKRNHFFKPLSWKVGDPSYAGQPWVVKNVLEFKLAKLAVVEGNILEQHWANQGQSGAAVLITPRNQSGTAPWSVVEDIDYRLNILCKSAGGFAINGEDENFPSQVTKRIKIENNLNYEIGTGIYTGNGRLFQISRGGEDFTINHNTSFHASTVIMFLANVRPNLNFAYMNNLSAHNTYGVWGENFGTGNVALNAFTQNATFQKNVLMGGNVTLYNQWPGGWNPTSLGFPSSWSGVLVNQAVPGTNFAGWKVVNGSSWDNAGTDGKDVGCDIDAVLAATAGCRTGVWGTTKTLKNGVNGYTGGSSFYVMGQTPTTNYNTTRYYMTSNSFAGTSGYVLRSFYKYDLNQGANAIPSGSTIVSAKLRMKLELNADTTLVSAHRMTPTTGFTVGYSTATRNTYNGTSAWTGGSNAGDQDHAGTADSSVVPPAVGQWMEFDVKNSVQAFVNGTANNGWVIKTVAGTIRTSTPSDSHGSAENAELVVEYQ